MSVVIATLVRLIQTYQDNDDNEFDDDEICFAQTWLYYEDLLLYTANYLRKILPSDQMPQVVIALKDYLGEHYKNSSYRYEAIYNIIWHCAQNMTYPDFYKAWHS